MTATGPLMLLDTASLYFRAYYGVPGTVRALDGTLANAVHGLIDMIARLITDHRPTRLVACWDEDWRPAFRVAAIPSYKAHRVAGGAATATGGPGDSQPAEEAVPDALAPQVPAIADLLAALGIARAGAPGFEADDVIGTLTARESGRGPVLVVTGDRDLFQLIDDTAQVRVLYTVRGIRNIEQVDTARLIERYAVTSGSAYADLAILRGDPSDGLPGVPGIGEKTAATLINRYGDLTGVLAARDRADSGLTATQRRHLTEAADYLAVAPGVVRVATDAPIELAPRPSLVDPDCLDLPRTPADPDALRDLTRRWGLNSPVRRLCVALAQQ